MLERLNANDREFVCGSIEEMCNRLAQDSCFTHLNDRLPTNHFPHMNRQQQDEALRLARMVRSGQLSKTAGTRLLNERAGVSLGSADIVIGNYLEISEGRVFKRTLSETDLDYFIGAIAADEGAMQLHKALSALRLHIQYREAENKVNPVKCRAILAKYETELTAMTSAGYAAPPVYLGDVELGFDDKVNEAKNSSHQERKKRLARAAKHPKSVVKLVYVFERNPDVVAEVLHRAGGYCEECEAAAPFTRKSNRTPYLEVHHKVPLAEEGEDTVENAVALCPNCHRRRHFG